MNSFYIYKERNVSKWTVAILATFGKDVLVKTPEFSRSLFSLSWFWLNKESDKIAQETLHFALRVLVKESFEITLGV